MMKDCDDSIGGEVDKGLRLRFLIMEIESRTKASSQFVEDTRFVGRAIRVCAILGKE